MLPRECPGRLGDIAAREQLGLGHVGVVLGLGAGVRRIRGPADEMIDGGLRAVGIEHLQGETARPQGGLDLVQGVGRRLREECRRRLVAVHRSADEILAP